MPSHLLPTTTVEELRRRADWCEDMGAIQASRAWKEAANLVAKLAHEHSTEGLNLTEAAEECGYSPDHLGRMVRSGEIPNIGRKNKPAIRRADLPRKPGAGIVVDLPA